MWLRVRVHSKGENKQKKRLHPQNECNLENHKRVVLRLIFFNKFLNTVLVNHGLFKGILITC